MLHVELVGLGELPTVCPSNKEALELWTAATPAPMPGEPAVDKWPYLLMGHATSKFGCVQGKPTNNWHLVSKNDVLSLAETSHTLAELMAAPEVKDADGNEIMVFPSVGEYGDATDARIDVTTRLGGGEHAWGVNIKSSLVSGDLSLLAWTAIVTGMITRPFFHAEVPNAYQPSNRPALLKAYADLLDALLASKETLQVAYGETCSWTKGTYVPPGYHAPTKMSWGPVALGAGAVLGVGVGIYLARRK
jgi:hypothetical protein